MVTRVRIEAEGSTPADVEQILYAAHEALTHPTQNMAAWDAMYGPADANGGGRAALADAQCGEMVIERFARDMKGEPGHGAIFFRGRMTTHYAAASQLLDLRHRQPGPESAPYVKS